MAKPARMRLSGSLDIPVVAASDVTARRVGGTTRLIVVGDRDAVIAASTYAPGGSVGPWDALDLAELPDWPLDPDEPSRLEAIAADGGSMVALLREDPSMVLVADIASREMLATISLVAPPWSALAGKWDDPTSRGEGVVLLRGGRLLVAKRKRPRALVEFGPKGTRARGLRRDDFLDPDEPWQPPSGEITYHALALWKLRGEAKSALGDISGISVGPDRSLWLLSDRSGLLARLELAAGLPRGGGAIRTLDEVFRLPKGATKAEGVAAVEPGRILVVREASAPTRNGMLLARPDDAEGEQ
jgi:hypothetical protein